MQAVQIEQTRTPKPHTTSKKTYITHWKALLNKVEERDSISPIRQNDEAGNRHNLYNNQPDCIAVDDAPSMTIKISPSPVKNIVRTRSGQVICILL